MYFYSDPLAAAWMAKHFGMQFDIAHTYECYDIGDFVQSDYSFNISEIERKYYVHLESLTLLEPLAGDILDFTDQDSTNIYQVSEKRRYYNDIDVNSAVAAINEGGKIIQRNGVVFHWPEKAP